MGKRESPKSGWDTGFSVLRAFKLDHLQPDKLILLRKFSVFWSLYWGLQFPRTWVRKYARAVTHSSHLGGATKDTNKHAIRVNLILNASRILAIERTSNFGSYGTQLLFKLDSLQPFKCWKQIFHLNLAYLDLPTKDGAAIAPRYPSTFCRLLCG